MKSGELATLLQVTTETIRQWIINPQFEQFFSPGAKAEHGGVHRIFNQDDVLVLNTIRHLRTNGVTDWYEIAQRLEQGERHQKFPPNAISGDPRTVPYEQADMGAKAAATLAERNAALLRVKELENEVTRLRGELDTERKNHMATIERLLREMSDLRHTIGRLEADKDK